MWHSLLFPLFYFLHCLILNDDLVMLGIGGGLPAALCLGMTFACDITICLDLCTVPAQNSLGL